MKMTVTVKEACEITGLGKTTLYSMMQQQRLRTVTVGRRRLIALDSLRALVGEAA